MSAIEVLEMAKERLRGHWCQGDYAMTNDGEMCAVQTPECRVCAHGAVLSLSLSGVVLGRLRALNLLSKAAEQVSNGMYRSAINYNDEKGRTEEEVLALFDKAIELAKAEELNAK